MGGPAGPVSVVPDLPSAFQQWVRCGVLKDILFLVAEGLHDEGYLDVREAFIDGTFAPAKKGGNCVGKTKRGKGTKIMAIADRHGRSGGGAPESATPHEVTLVKATIAQRLVLKRPEHLIGDTAYESDQLDAELAAAWHRADRSSPTRPQAQDAGWPTASSISAAVESGTAIRVASELPTRRRALQRHAENFLGMLHLACC